MPDREGERLRHAHVSVQCRDCRVVRWLTAGWLACLVAAASCGRHPGPSRLVIGVGSSGQASAEWLAVLQKRLPPSAYDSIAPARKPLTTEEGEWIVLIHQRAPSWERMVAPLATLWRPASPPERVRIVLGNRGAEDAFTHDERTIGFDLAALQANYGGAGQAGNGDRLDRFFRHEFTHLLQKAWLSLNPWCDRSPLGMALLDIWAEGLGNYYSLSDRWVDANGQLTSTARGTLTDLEPRLTAKLDTLARIDSAAAGPVLAGLSSGPFAQQWGALPAALWLAAEPGPADSALRRFIVAGPAGVWDLAGRHLPQPLGAALQDTRAAAARCRPR